jgi:hypothetical protein
VTNGFDKVGITVSPPLLQVILPIGISFFTFQAMSYVIDAYRDNLKPVGLLDFAVYLSFFPHLVAGPIVRATEFLPQLRKRADPRRIEAAHAFRLIVAGMFKKVVVSSFLASAIVDRSSPHPATAPRSCSRSTGARSRSTPTSAATPHRHRVRLALFRRTSTRPTPRPAGLLAPLAHDLAWLRTPLHLWAAPRRPVEDAPQPHAHDADRRTVARRAGRLLCGVAYGVGLAVGGCARPPRALASPSRRHGVAPVRRLVRDVQVVCLAVFFRAPTFTIAVDAASLFFLAGRPRSSPACWSSRCWPC